MKGHIQAAQSRAVRAEYPHVFPDRPVNGQPPVAQLPVDQLPWAHNVLLMQRVKDLPTRHWYMEQTLANGRSRNTLKDPYIDLLFYHLRLRAFVVIDKPIGISTYELTRALPARLQSALPTVEEIEAELGPARKKP